MSKKVLAASAASTSQSQVTLVKVEAADGEGVQDIQNYLHSFNKEIETNPEGARDGNTYFVDSSGQFYYGQRVVCVTEDGDNVVDEAEPGTPAAVVVENDPLIENPLTSGEGQTVTLTGDGEQVLLNAGGQYGAVTILPQENNGEVSYVLFVPNTSAKGEDSDGQVEMVEGEQTETVQLDDEMGEEEDGDHLAVYDFEEDGNASVEPVANESEVEEEKPKPIKTPKKNLQTIVTAHMCNYCNYTSPKRYLLSRHMKSHSEERPHKCSVCERGFKTLASLQNHVNTHTGTKPHQCRFCDSSFTTSGELVRHIRYKHTLERPHRCPSCNYSSVELSKLKRHVRCHTGERPYQCPHCTYASPDTFKLKRHLRIHTGEKPYECDICRARFTQSNSLKAHRLIHSVADKPVFKCELCPVTCGRKTDLRVHVQKLHTSDRLLKCKRCGKTFPDRYTYKVHNKTHEGEKCFRCGLCPYASVSARHLESHLLIHTDQKPYQCEMCDQAFRQKQLLRRHQNLYHTPDYAPPPPKEKTHECPECGRTFRHKGNLIRHMALHDPDSSTQEKQMALKIGRQKKVQFIDGQQVELMSDEDEMNSESAGVVMSDESGRPYVVLEVIQLPDGQGTEFVMSTREATELEEDMIDNPVLTTAAEDAHDPLEDEEAQQLIKLERKKDKSEEVDNCFGFDDEDEDIAEVEEDEDEEMETKPIPED